jgi:hypothetical protein
MGYYFIRKRITNASSGRNPSTPKFFNHFKTATARHPPRCI